MSMQGDKPTTIKEIAKKLKISPSTVSRALNDHPSIGLVTTMRVKKVAEELNYEPNQTAIFFKQRKTFTIGVLLPSLSEPFFSSAISEIENVSNDRKYTVIMGQSLDDAEREERILKTFKSHRVDGVLMSVGKNTTNLEFLEKLENSGTPIVFFDCVPDIPKINKVESDLATGMNEAIDAFVARGHVKIALINGPQLLPASEERKNSFLSALKRNGLDYDEKYIVNTDLTTEGNEAAMEKLYALPERPTAVVSFNDFVTLDVMKAARNRGLVLNHDIHFISYANYPLWKYMENPPMGCIEQFPGNQAKKAAEILFEKINNAGLAPQQIVFKSRLIM
ncbi:LacI family transcriptional regulator [Sphingobacterium sp. PCS056]|uniref:LacI family DNA-binding transcriptional regulator n=1 Tax=Sphingobacterium sp. PCS056 TaxID=2931400 RepID=UPI00200EF9A6|nr:LacI family DNA-binding transcriptional regulator [Sphingobacterium sp. PCS056]UPZ37028.1 LacI family transcriptional regulator [Sphingobacterium sp. PCS056]